MSHCVSLGCLALLLTASVGCNQPDPIVTYTVPTKVPDQLLPGKDRMLAAIVPYQDQAWFFKVTGPEEAIEMVEKPFKQFVKDVQFKGGNPDLDELPDGWRRGGEKPFRYASIDVTVPGKQLDISVSKLTKQDDWDAYVAMNVNRWRGQLGVDDSDEKWAGGTPLQVAVAEGESVWFDMVGDPTKATNSMAPPMSRGGPFASGGSMPPGTVPSVSPSAGAASEADSRLDYDAPDGWRPGKKSSMRLASFYVGPETEEKQSEVTVMQAGGDLRANVARWIGQIRSDVPDEVVDKALADAQELQVAGRAGKRYVLNGEKADEGDAIDATIVPLEGGFSMFIKMTGPATTVADQNDAMIQFLKSLKF